MPATEKEKKPRRKPGRVPTSCAECRRQKLKCDKTVPCEKCVSRGLASLCPDRCLAPGKGNRMVLADTEELHERIEILCNRIRDLEDALQAAYGSAPEHPLLKKSLLDLKGSPGIITEKPTPLQPIGHHAPVIADPRVEYHRVGTTTVDAAEEAAVVDAFGTLTIGAIGEANFLGQTARSEYLIRAPDGHRDTEPAATARSVVDVLTTSDVSLISEQGVTALGEQIYQKLPPLSEALNLCDIYIQHGQYIYTPMDKTFLIDRAVHTLYALQTFNEHNFKCQQGLAFLFIVFALGALFDPSRPANSPTAHEYYMLSRSALMLVNPVRDSTLLIIQTMIHTAQFLELSDWNSMASGTSWVFSGMAIKLGYSLGLHLNSARWNVSADDTKNRTALFSQLFVLDTWQSFGFGRPPSIAPEFVDAGVPVDTQEHVDKNGQKSIGYHHWMWQYTAVLHSMMSSAFGVKPPSYKSVVDLDRRIRDFPVPSYLRPQCPGHGGPEELYAPSKTHMQRWGVLAAKEWTLLNLHRPYFARALEDRPQELLRHRYTASVLAAYRSAWRLIEGFCTMPYKNVRRIIYRVNLAWSQALSAAIVMCMLVTRAPQSTLTASSLEKLDSVARIFEEAASESPAAAKNLKSIQTLRQKAHDAVNQHNSTSNMTRHAEDETTSISPAELDRLSGKTHLIQETPRFLPDGSLNPDAHTPSSGTSSYHTTPSPPPSSNSSTASHAVSPSTINVHSRIAKDMAAFHTTEPLVDAYALMFDEPSETFPMDIEFDASGRATVPVTSVPSQDGMAQFMNEMSNVRRTGNGAANANAHWLYGNGIDGVNNNTHQLFAVSGSGFEQPQSEGLTLDPGWQYFVEQLGF